MCANKESKFLYDNESENTLEGLAFMKIVQLHSNYAKTLKQSELYGILVFDEVCRVHEYNRQSFYRAKMRKNKHDCDEY